MPDFEQIDDAETIWAILDLLDKTSEDINFIPRAARSSSGRPVAAVHPIGLPIQVRPPLLCWTLSRMIQIRIVRPLCAQEASISNWPGMRWAEGSDDADPFIWAVYLCIARVPADLSIADLLKS